MQGERWLEVVMDLPTDLADQAGELLMERGAGGYELRDRDTLLATASRDRVLVVGYLPPRTPGATERALREALVNRLGEAQAEAVGVTVRTVSDPGWAELWKEFFEPIEIGGSLVITPPWRDPATRRAKLILDPGMAFGTGNHPTTRLCLEILDEVAPDRLLDVGCGSGILSIACALLHGTRCLGVDNDPLAVDAARENAARNHVEHLVRFDPTPLGELPGRYPVVVANILAHILLDLSEDLVGHLSPGGRLIMSGVLDHQLDAVMGRFEGLGLVASDQRTMAGDGTDRWVALVLEAPGEGEG